MDEKLLEQLKNLSQETKRDLSDLLEEAVRDLVSKKGLRPIYLNAADDAFKAFDHDLEILSK